MVSKRRITWQSKYGPASFKANHFGSKDGVWVQDLVVLAVWQ